MKHSKIALSLMILFTASTVNSQTFVMKGAQISGKGPVPAQLAAEMCTGASTMKTNDVVEVLKVEFFPPVQASTVSPRFKMAASSGEVFPVKVWTRFVLINSFNQQRTYVTNNRVGFIVRDRAFNETYCSSIKMGS